MTQYPMQAQETDLSGAPSHMIELMLTVILDVLEAESGSIMMSGKAKESLQIQTDKELKKKIIQHTRVKLESDRSGAVSESDKPFLIDKIPSDKRKKYKQEEPVKPETGVSYIIPLTLYDGTVGTLNINATKLSKSQLETKHELIQDILTRFCEYLYLADLPKPHNTPPSQIYMMNIFREYNALREFRIVFDYIFQLITQITELPQKGVFCLKNEESGYFDLVLGYGFETKNYREIYEELIPCLKAPNIETEYNIRIFNKKEISLSTRYFNENYVILLPLALPKRNGKIEGQLVLLSDTPPDQINTQKPLIETICRIAAGIIDKSKSNRYFHDLTYTDSLTGTYNYGLWWKRLEEEFSRASREKEMILSLLILDVDDLNRINTTLGYMAGDQLLRFIADKIKTCVRANDIVGRIGGEEFGVILIQSSRESALMIANRIITAVSTIPKEMNIDFKVPITLSGGIATMPQDADRPDALVEKANTALLSSKIMGGNQVKVFDTLEE